MKQDHVNYFMVGSVVIIMVTLLFLVLVRITNHNGATDSYFVIYNNIADIQEGTAVTYGGFQIGQVNRITPLFKKNHTLFNLELTVREGWQIPEDSVANIVSPGLLSDKQINITEGISSVKLSPGNTINSQESADIFAVMDTVANEIKDLSDYSVKPLITKLSQRIDGIASHIDTIGSDIGQKVPHIITSIEQILARLNEGLTQLSGMFDWENKQHVTHILANIDTTSENLITIIKNFDAAIVQLSEFINNSNKLVMYNDDDIRTTVIDLKTSLESVSRNIDSIVYNLETTSRNFNEFSRKVSAYPGIILGSKPPKDDAEESR
ncbi:MAG: MlaD family protein [bacterium]